MHIPFCDSKCFYCAFNSYTNMFHLKKEYMKALKKQLKSDIKNYLCKEKIETVFLGGGTPSCIKADEYEEVFEIIRPYLKENAEITTEANPNSASYEWLEKMKKYGVTRVSFGVQSFDDDKLRLLGRAHNANSAITAIQNAKCIGFKGINCDIIYGVQDDTFESLKADFDQIKALGINHMSAYSLVIEEGTKFFNKSSVKIDDEELSYKLFDYIKSLGFTQYEISNFATDKKYKSNHNYGYWEGKNYLGVGAGAVGFVKNKRYYPKKDIQEYINDPLTPDFEDLTPQDIKVEKILLGFRCDNGVKLDLFNQNELKKIKTLLEEDKIIQNDKTIYNKNFLLADELALFIID